jgi:hypothetical protein
MFMARPISVKTIAVIKKPKKNRIPEPMGLRMAVITAFWMRMFSSSLR